MKKILKRGTRTSKREIPAAAGGASTNAVRRTTSQPSRIVRAATSASLAPSGEREGVRGRAANAGGARLPASRSMQTTKKPSPIELLQSAIAIRRKSQTELSDLNKWLADKTARQTALEKTGNLHDRAVIAEIGTLQIFTGLLPRRIAAKEADDAQAEESLTNATNDFIHQHLGPRVRKLAAQTREQVETELSPHFQDRAALLRAIAQSQQVRTIDASAWTATSQPKDGAIAHAEGALKAWAAADEFEKTL